MKTRLAKNLFGVFLLAALLVGGLLILSHPVEASTAKSGLDAAAQEAYGKNAAATPVGTLVGGIVRTVINVSGLIMIVLVVYAGVLYLTAAGDDAKIKKAKSLLSSSVIGIVIILAAYAITTFVLARLASIT